MNASALPGQTLQSLPAGSGGGRDDVLSLLQKSVENSYNWAVSLGQGGYRAERNDDQFALYSKLCRNLNSVLAG